MYKEMIFVKQGKDYLIYIPEELVETAIHLAH